MSTVLRMGSQDKSLTALPEGDALDTRIALIQALIPLGLHAVEELLQQDVQALAGPRYARADGRPHRVRWGRQLARGGPDVPAGDAGPAQPEGVGHRLRRAPIIPTAQPVEDPPQHTLIRGC